MIPLVRPLDPIADREAVADLFRRSADYVLLERGEPPGEEVVNEFFTDAVPGSSAAAQLKLGMAENGPLIGLADMGFGYPAAGDAYIGLLQFDAAARGRGLGARFLRHLEAAARAAGARRMFVAVLDANPRGRAFWQREGFTVETEAVPVTLGRRTQGASRLVKPL